MDIDRMDINWTGTLNTTIPSFDVNKLNDKISSISCENLSTLLQTELKYENLKGEEKVEEQLTQEERKFNQVKQMAIDVINCHKEYLIDKISKEKNAEIEEITKGSEIQKLIDKHDENLRKELDELFNDNVEAGAIRRIIICPGFKLTNYLTKDEDEKIDKIIKTYDDRIESVKQYAQRLIGSLKLCQFPYQILDILKDEGLIYSNGIIKKNENVENKFE